MAYDSDAIEAAMVDDLCRRLTDVCQDYDSETIFCALAEMLTLTCGECTNIAAFDEFIDLFEARVRSIWLEKAPITGGPQ